LKIGISALQVSEKNSGIGQYIINLLENVIKLDKDYSYFVFTSQGVKLRGVEDKVNTTIIEQNFQKNSFFKRNVFELFQLGRTVNKYQPNIYFAPDSKLPLGLDKEIKKVITIHDLAIFKFPDAYQRTRILYWRQFFTHSVKNADKVVAISQATKDDLIDILKVPEEKIQVIHNGVSNSFKRWIDPHALKLVQHKYSLPDKFIFFVGTFSPRKNLGRLMEAVGRIHMEGIPYNLVIAGEKGWKYQNDLDRVKALNLEDKIFFPGYISPEDLPGVYSLADIFAYPSIYEGFGLPLLEAMSCGTPVITSNTSSLPEVVGQAGVFVDPFSVDSIAQGLMRVIIDYKLKEKLVQEGYQRVQQFSWLKAAKEIQYLFAQLTN